MRLIDATEFIEALEAVKKAGMLTVDTVFLLLNVAPPIDAVKVQHGKWVDEGSHEYFTGLTRWNGCKSVKCSVCGYEVPYLGEWHNISENYHYCSNCGAKMDKDDAP